MKVNQLIFWGIFVAMVACGCAPHYYQVNEQQITLYLRQTNAEQVVFFSSLDGFAPHVNDKIGGSWVVTMPAGREFCYFYKVDGKIHTPWCRIREKDDFGKENCVYVPDS